MISQTKKAILMVSFGTSHMDALNKNIVRIEEQAGETFPGHRIYRAFTSGMIISKLKKTEKLSVCTVKQAMEQMAADGMEQILVQPTHIINGIENDKMLADIREYAGSFQKVSVGSPLLTSGEDYKKAVHAVMEEAELQEGEALVFMGHGTDHHANSAYPTLEYIFHSMGYSQVLVGTVEGFPDLNHVMAKLQTAGTRKVTLMPFMVVAGDHAKNDMAGDEDSWKIRLQEAGYEVRAVVKGLGEIAGIRNLYMEHIRAAM